MYKYLRDSLNWSLKISFPESKLSFSGATGFMANNLILYFVPEGQK